MLSFGLISSPFCSFQQIISTCNLHVRLDYQPGTAGNYLPRVPRPTGGPKTFRFTFVMFFLDLENHSLWFEL